MNRSVQEVTFQAARLKESVYRQSDSVAEAIIKEASKKVKKVDVKPTVADVSDKLWTQEQQELLETALSKYPKTAVGDRWQKIANTVPGKTKEECLARYKYLAQKIIKEQKLKAEEAAKQKSMEESEKLKNTDEVKPIPSTNSDEESSNNGTVLRQHNKGVLVNNEVLEESLERKSGGKPRNKRKERKKRMEYSSDEEEYDHDN